MPDDANAKIQNLGQILITPNARQRIEDTQTDAVQYIRRHKGGDWGLVCPEDWLANDEAAVDGGRIVSAYPLADGSGRIWIITEADRSATTVLLPEDY